jgi:hypothetical protein
MRLISYIDMNVWVIFGILVVMIGLYLLAQLKLGQWTWGPTILTGWKYPSAVISFWFFFALFAFFLLEYLLGDWYEGMPSNAHHSWHGYVHVADAVVGNLASLFMLMCAVVYSGGKDVKFAPIILSVMAYAFIVAVWAVIFELFDHTSSDFATALETAPEILLASVAGTALGWVFLARWGWTAMPFLVVTIAYALLQSPAYIRGEFRHLTTPLGQSIRASNLDFAYALLAGGKILLAFGFLSLLCGSTNPEVNLDQPKNTPDKTVQAPKSWHHGLTWVVTVAGGLIISIFTEPFGSAIRKYLGWQ